MTSTVAQCATIRALPALLVAPVAAQRASAGINGRLVSQRAAVCVAHDLTSLMHRCAAAFGKALNFVTASSQHVTVPSGVWFSGAFTMEGWVYIRSFPVYSRLFDFGNGAGASNILLAVTQGTSGMPAVDMFTTGGSSCSQFASPSALPLNTWTHLAATFDGTSLWTIYVNGASVKTGTSSCVEPSVTRTLNYIGRSNWAGDGYADGLFDDMRIWNVSRTASQILTRLVWADGSIPARCVAERALLTAVTRARWWARTRVSHCTTSSMRAAEQWPPTPPAQGQGSMARS